MKRIPIVATLVVFVAIAAMIALGVWQLHRLRWKEALLARYSVAAEQPPMTFPTAYPIGDEVLFRRATATCQAVVSWAAEAGRSVSGKSGWRHIATCVARPGQPPVRVDVGISNDPAAPGWAGGAVMGTMTWAPEHISALAQIGGQRAPREPMIVADRAAPGLEPSIQPSIADIPNNHLSYAIQWFCFAVTAAVIYVLALRRRMIADRRDPS